MGGSGRNANWPPTTFCRAGARRATAADAPGGADATLRRLGDRARAARAGPVLGASEPVSWPAGHAGPRAPALPRGRHAPRLLAWLRGRRPFQQISLLAGCALRRPCHLRAQASMRQRGASPPAGTPRASQEGAQIHKPACTRLGPAAGRPAPLAHHTQCRIPTAAARTAPVSCTAVHSDGRPRPIRPPPPPHHAPAPLPRKVYPMPPPFHQNVMLPAVRAGERTPHSSLAAAPSGAAEGEAL